MVQPLLGPGPGTTALLLVVLATLSTICRAQGGGGPHGSALHPTFYELAKASGTDKVTNHQYHVVYQKYLPPMRHHAVNILEIGLGCLSRPFGASMQLWMRYFPHPGTRVSFIEFNPECRNRFVDAIHPGQIYLGDQSNTTFLGEVAADMLRLGGCDIIIDDGSHHAIHQQISFNALWKVVKPDGVYVIEDLEGKEVIDFVANHVKMMHRNATTDISSVDMFYEAVVFKKKGAGRR